MKTILTRIGENAKMVFLGDTKQTDNKDLLKRGVKSGFQTALDKLNEIDEIGLIEFTNEDIVRNPLITKILEKWESE